MALLGCVALAATTYKGMRVQPMVYTINIRRVLSWITIKAQLIRPSAMRNY